MNTEKLLLIISNLLIAVVVLVFLAIYFSANFNGLEFDKKFLVRDLGLSIDALSISSYNIEMIYEFQREYNLNIKDLILKIKTKEIDISEEYNLISEIKDLSLKSNQTTIKKQNNKLNIK